MLQKLRGVSREKVQPELEGLQAMVAREFKEEPRISDLWATRGQVKALGEYLEMLQNNIAKRKYYNMVCVKIKI